MKNELSEKLFERACRVIPSGVNSPVRAFGAVKGNPPFILKGKGSRIYDADGNEYIDFCCSWGPLILGHADSDVIEAVAAASQNGLSFGACTKAEVELAELLADLVPYADMFRLVSSGTEAVMTALRLARGYTGKRFILKFDGCYHGHSDSLLVASGSGLLTGSQATSAGVTEAVASEVISVPYGSEKDVEAFFAKFADNAAAVIIEPVPGNMGLIKPPQGFLEFLREICTKNNTCLIFDEVITGFRFHPGTYASTIGIEPDITTLGKIAGGGMPLGVIAARKNIMENLAPLGNVYQAGTLSGNPVAVAAGTATLKKLVETNPYPRMTALAAKFAEKINEFAKSAEIPVSCLSNGSMFTLFFRAAPPENLEQAKECNTDTFAEYHRYMLEHGFYLPPSQFEVNFISSAHTEKDVDSALETALSFLKKLSS